VHHRPSQDYPVHSIKNPMPVKRTTGICLDGSQHRVCTSQLHSHVTGSRPFLALAIECDGWPSPQAADLSYFKLLGTSSLVSEAFQAMVALITTCTHTSVDCVWIISPLKSSPSCLVMIGVSPVNSRRPTHTQLPYLLRVLESLRSYHEREQFFQWGPRDDWMP